MTDGPAPWRIDRDVLMEFTTTVLEKAGLSPEHAIDVASILIEGDARGLPSHGVVRLLPVYVDRLVRRAMNPSPHLKVLSQHAATVHIDGDGGPGQVAGRFAMNHVVELARSAGAGVALVRNSAHYGIGSAYVEQATREGLVGVALTNAPSNVPPAGGRAKYFGTNPLTIGVPYTESRPIILDMSTSVVARGKIVIAQQEGKTIPEGWAIDHDGNPTTDPARALTGAVLPMAGYKGAGLALMIDVLAGLLSGAAYGSHIVDLYDAGDAYQDVGHFFLAVNVEHFMPPEIFQQRMGEFVEDVRRQPTLPGVDRILLPGEIEHESARQSQEHGIPLTAAGISELDRLADKMEIQRLGTIRRPSP